MAELKSAWEIAQEKADKLGKLSAEEQRQQMEQRCQQTGRAMAQRYLGNWEQQRLAIELSSRPEEEQKLITQAIIAHLSEALSLRTASPQDTRLEKILQGIATVKPELQPTTSQISLLIQEYHQAGNRTRQEIESKTRERLHQLRISGTAVGEINIEAIPQWQEAWHELAQPFEQRLNSLKQDLIHKSCP
jgi:hypothetical protein